MNNFVLVGTDGEPVSVEKNGGEKTELKLSDAIRWALEVLVEFQLDARGIRSSARLDSAIKGDPAELVLDDKDRERLVAALAEPKVAGQDGNAIRCGYFLTPARLNIQILDALSKKKESNDD